jgi:hypothetical protein
MAIISFACLVCSRSFDSGTVNALGVWTFSPNDAWAVGFGGVILR